MTDREYLRKHYPQIVRRGPMPPLEEVEALLDAGVWRLLVVARGKKKCGLLLYAITENGSRALTIRGMYLAPGFPVSEWATINEKMREEARDKGCSSIFLDTQRAGWERRLAPFGFRRLPYYRLETRL